MTKKASKPKAKTSRKPIFHRALEFAERQLEKARADYTKYQAKAEKARQDIPRLQDIVSVLRGESNVGRAEITKLIPPIPLGPDVKPPKRESVELLPDIPVSAADSLDDNRFLPDIK